MPDVIVIGGGVVGAACAYELARRGSSVTLIERDELAAGASGRNQGWFVLSDDPPLRPMSAGSLAMYREVIDGSDVPVRFDPQPVGHLMVATTDNGAAAIRSRVASREAAGTKAERLDDAALRDVEPALSPDLTEAWLLDQGRRIDPGALTVALALSARANGADVRTHCTVRDVVDDGSRVTGVVTDDGVLRGDAVVLAAGPWSTPLARKQGVVLPVTGARGWIVELDGTPDLLRHLIEEEDGDWSDEDAPTAAELGHGTPREPGVSALLHQSADDAIVCGASHHLALRPEAEDLDAPARIARRAARVAPALADLTVRGIRWGIRPMSPDDRPLVGWMREGLLAATGHGPEGVLLAGGTAQLVASIVLDEPRPFAAEAFDPFRFEG
ncbi:MAG TPA: FAD-dependent oxidoreductase [Actinomycetota bacterium]|nr:FAD-dependent oxidoreductase [Actinomycetota bacterium]